MSAVDATVPEAVVASPLSRRDATPSLAVVPPARRRRRPRVVYALVALAGAVAIAGGQMVLSILTTQSTYELAQLKTQQRQLNWDRQILYDEVAGLSSPQYLAANASALGMVIDESPSYLRLSDGMVLGTGSASVGASSVDALGRGSVPNALITDTPLVTDPDATIQGAPTPTDPTADATGAPPALTDGLPTPDTH